MSISCCAATASDSAVSIEPVQQKNSAQVCTLAIWQVFTKRYQSIVNQLSIARCAATASDSAVSIEGAQLNQKSALSALGVLTTWGRVSAREARIQYSAYNLG